MSEKTLSQPKISSADVIGMSHDKNNAYEKILP